MVVVVVVVSFFMLCCLVVFDELKVCSAQRILVFQMAALGVYIVVEQIHDFSSVRCLFADKSSGMYL